MLESPKGKALSLTKPCYEIFKDNEQFNKFFKTSMFKNAPDAGEVDDDGEEQGAEDGGDGESMATGATPSAASSSSFTTPKRPRTSSLQSPMTLRSTLSASQRKALVGLRALGRST